MQLTKDQKRAVYNLYSEQINLRRDKAYKESQRMNKLADQESLKSFKQTKEYEAFLLLSQAFKKTKIIDKGAEMLLARRMFPPKYVNTYVDFMNFSDIIELISIDCKNLEELKGKIVNHYKLKKVK